MIAPLKDRLYGRTVADPTTFCVIWQGCINSKGYGVISRDGQRVLTHRLAYELAHGPIPDGMTVDHTCFNTRCINVTHLRLLSRSENSANQRSAHKTHCVHGHELTDPNTIIKKRRDGGTIRNCRTCNNAQQRARAWAKRHLDRDLTAAELAEFCARAA